MIKIVTNLIINLCFICCLMWGFLRMIWIRHETYRSSSELYVEVYIVIIVLLLTLSVNCSLMREYECYQQINEVCVHNDLGGGSCGQAFVCRYPHTVLNSGTFIWIWQWFRREKSRILALMLVTSNLTWNFNWCTWLSSQRSRNPACTARGRTATSPTKNPTFATSSITV